MIYRTVSQNTHNKDHVHPRHTKIFFVKNLPCKTNQINNFILKGRCNFLTEPTKEILTPLLKSKNIYIKCTEKRLEDCKHHKTISGGGG
jgi:hypothetical protein